jgi:hypothetical protein
VWIILIYKEPNVKILAQKNSIQTILNGSVSHVMPNVNFVLGLILTNVLNVSSKHFQLISIIYWDQPVLKLADMENILIQLKKNVKIVRLVTLVLEALQIV